MVSPVVVFALKNDSTFNQNIFQSHLDDLLDPCDEGDHVIARVILRYSNSGTLSSVCGPQTMK